jgi:site-specific DNA-methyltransferase (adenine-specific)
MRYKILNDAQYPTTIIDHGTVLKYQKEKGLNLSIHPAQKPIGLIIKLIEMYSNKGDIVLDTCSGSGVVAHACKYLERDFIATEIDTSYYDLSIERLNSCLLTNMV